MPSQAAKASTGSSTGTSLLLLFLITAGLILLFRSHTYNGSTFGTSPFRLHLPPPLPQRKSVVRLLSTHQSSKQSVDDTEQCHILHQTNSCHKLPNYFIHSSKREQIQGAFINFMHVPKSGGTTMKECMKDVSTHLGITEPFLLHTDGRLQLTQDLLNGDYHILKETSIFMGDYSFGFCDLIHDKIGDRKCSTFIILREPYERMVSNYYYCRELNQTIPGIPDCRSHPITEWALRTKSILWNEFFTDIDCEKNGTWHCSIDYSPLISAAYVLGRNRSFVKSVVSNLDKHFSVIGLVDEFPTTLKLLQLAYKLPFFKVCQSIDYNVGSYDNASHLNKVQTRKKAKEILTRDPKVRQLLYPEVEIYKKAKEIFKIQKKALKDVLNSRTKSRREKKSIQNKLIEIKRERF